MSVKDDAMVAVHSALLAVQTEVSVIGADLAAAKAAVEAKVLYPFNLLQIADAKHTISMPPITSMAMAYRISPEPKLHNIVIASVTSERARIGFPNELVHAPMAASG